jgi:hypothetical protein
MAKKEKPEIEAQEEPEKKSEVKSHSHGESLISQIFGKGKRNKNKRYWSRET